MGNVTVEDKNKMARTTEEKKSWTGDLIQLAGLIMLGAGVGLELAFRAHIWFILITAGSVVFAIGTKLKGR